MASSASTPSYRRPTKLAKWHIPALLGLSLFWLIWCLCLLYNSTTARPAILAQKLPASTDVLTPAFASSTLPTTSVTWSDSQAPLIFDEAITNQRNTFVSFAYQAHYQSNTALEINQVVSDAVWPVFAAWQTIRAQPGRRDQVDDVGFRRLSLPYQSAVANQQRAVCMPNGVDGCRIAYVWAQYGQYVVRLRVAGQNQAVSSKLISALFEQIDHHITQTFQGSHD